MSAVRRPRYKAFGLNGFQALFFEYPAYLFSALRNTFLLQCRGNTPGPVTVTVFGKHIQDMHAHLCPIRSIPVGIAFQSVVKAAFADLHCHALFLNRILLLMLPDELIDLQNAGQLKMAKAFLGCHAPFPVPECVYATGAFHRRSLAGRCQSDYLFFLCRLLQR